MSKPNSPNSRSDKTEDASVARSFEDNMAELESIIERIESGEVGLEESIVAYERGVAIVESCRGVLAAAELRVEELTERLRAGDEPGGER